MDTVKILAGIVVINLLLSGDNALVIALASRNLPETQQKKSNFMGRTRCGTATGCPDISSGIFISCSLYSTVRRFILTLGCH